MQYGMASYELHGLFCSFASQKNYMALYVCETDAVAVHRSQPQGAEDQKIERSLEQIHTLRLPDLHGSQSTMYDGLLSPEVYAAASFFRFVSVRAA